MLRFLPVIALSVGCTPKASELVQPWRFEARTTHGVVRVLPVVSTVGRDDVPLDSYVGAGLPWIREWLRSRRMAEVHRIPSAVGSALPGAVNGELGSQWDGQFVRGHFAPGSRAMLRGALKGRGDLDEALSTSVRGLDGSAALVTWVSGLESAPLTARGFPGEIVHTDSGPVVLDFIEEPFLVHARIGVALVARDGEVVLRYSDTFTTVLSARRDSTSAAIDLASELAREVAKVWALDPRLEDDAPSDPVAAL